MFEDSEKSTKLNSSGKLSQSMLSKSYLCASIKTFRGKVVRHAQQFSFLGSLARISLILQLSQCPMAIFLELCGSWDISSSFANYRKEQGYRKPSVNSLHGTLADLSSILLFAPFFSRFVLFPPVTCVVTLLGTGGRKIDKLIRFDLEKIFAKPPPLFLF